MSDISVQYTWQSPELKHVCKLWCYPCILIYIKFNIYINDTNFELTILVLVNQENTNYNCHCNISNIIMSVSWEVIWTGNAQSSLLSCKVWKTSLFTNKATPMLRFCYGQSTGCLTWHWPLHRLACHTKMWVTKKPTWWKGRKTAKLNNRQRDRQIIQSTARRKAKRRYFTLLVYTA